MKVSRLLSRFSVICAVLLLLGGCGKKSDPLGAAKQFFEQIAAGKTQEAYASAAFGFQAQQSESVFAQTVREMGLAEFASAEWQPAEISGREARLPVTVRTKQGEELPFVVTLVEESGKWRVHALRTPRNGSMTRTDNRFSLVGKGAGFSDALNRPLPTDAEVQVLTRETLLAFNQAIRQQSFTEFYAGVSTAWQKQLTEGQLQRAFQPFIEKGVDLKGIAALPAVIDPPPFISTDGLLMVSGHYPTQPYKVHFSLKYIYELPRWKLFGIDVNLRQ